MSYHTDHTMIASLLRKGLCATAIVSRGDHRVVRLDGEQLVMQASSDPAQRAFSGEWVPLPEGTEVETYRPAQSGDVVVGLPGDSGRLPRAR